LQSSPAVSGMVATVGYKSQSRSLQMQVRLSSSQDRVAWMEWVVGDSSVAGTVRSDGLHRESGVDTRLNQLDKSRKKYSGSVAAISQRHIAIVSAVEWSRQSVLILGPERRQRNVATVSQDRDECYRLLLLQWILRQSVYKSARPSERNCRCSSAVVSQDKWRGVEWVLVVQLQRR
jgi:hypothetical protein